MVTPEIALVAFFAGLLPALLWLVFWLLEDAKRPEPKWLVLVAFITGMVAVVAVLPLQGATLGVISMGPGLIIVWALIEEVMKFALGWIIVLRHRAVDEPLDFLLYLVTIALGFAALENTLFLLSPLAEGRFMESIVMGNLRFIGATLIHVLSSAIIGAALAFAFYREMRHKILYGAVGVILATALHALFNFLIISTGQAQLLTVFLGVWVGIIFLLLMFERVKLVRRPAWWEKVFTKSV